MKTLSLIISAVLIIISATGFDPTTVPSGFPDGSNNYYIFSFLFSLISHGNIFHCLANCWALLTAAFLMRTRIYEFIISYIIAQCLMLLPWPQTIIGISGCIYALFAMVSLRRRFLWKFHALMGVFIIISIFIPAFAGWYHLSCYVAGLLVGSFFMPLPLWLQKRLT